MYHVTACLGSVMVATIVEEFGWRKVVFATGFLSSLGIALSAFTTSVDFLFFSYSILAGWGQRILLFTSIHVAVSYFPNHQNLVNGIVSSGSGLALVLSAPFLAYLNEEYSFRGCALIFSGVSLNVCVAAMTFHPVEWHMDSPYLNFGIASVNDQAFPSGKTGKVCVVLWNIWKGAGNTLRLITSPHAVLLSIIVCFNIGIFVNVWTFIPFVMRFEGYTADESSFFMSVAAGCNLGGRLLSIVLGCCVEQKSHVIYILGTILSAGTLSAFGTEGNLCWKITNLSLCILGYGITFNLNTMIIIEIMGIDMLLPVTGLLGMFTTVWHLVMGPLIGVVIDAYGSYNVGLYFLAGLNIFSLLVWALIPIADAYCQRCPNHAHHQEHQYFSQQQQQQQQPQHQQHTLPLRENFSLLHRAEGHPAGYASVVH
ncbi:monocarboxylate transporter 12-like isoform X2 [Scylla paramamosain]